MTDRLLLVTSPLLAGADVLALQRRLDVLGYEPGPLDGRYGPATERAVRGFQAAARIEVDGIVGPETRAALATARPQTASPGSAIGRRAVAEARRWVGTKEDPAGSNRTPFGAWFGLDGVPWCAIFLSYCFAVGAGSTIARGFKGAGCTPRGCAYVPSIEAWLRATGMWLGRAAPLPGDIAVYNWDGGAPDHVGIVERVGDGSFTAIEGNTGEGANAGGGEVMRRGRTLEEVDGFGRLADPHALLTLSEPRPNPALRGRH